MKTRIPALLLWSCAAAAQAQTTIDFSFAGYGGGGVSAPVVAAVISVRPGGGDDTALLQSAIDRVSALPLRNDGFRGAVLLQSGRYLVEGQLQIRASGVVIRGAANAVIVAAGRGRRTLIEIGNRSGPQTESPVAVSDEAVPAGAVELTVDNLAAVRRGDRVVIRRPSTKEWISALGMNGLPGSYANLRIDWTPGSRDLVWDRIVTAVDLARRKIVLDAPITTALERRYGGGSVARVSSDPPLTHIGIEDLTLESATDAANPRDEEHSWIAVALDRVEDAWARRVVARRFAGSAVRVGPRARRITVEACRSEAPVSEPAGYRRLSFLVEGQQTLVRQCRSEQGMNDFAVGLLAAGPNVFLDSTAVGALGPSGSFESWASAVLYERVKIEGAGIRLSKDGSRSQGDGWTAANSVVWNCEAGRIDVDGPPGAANIVNRASEPLYEAQLTKRTGAELPPVAHAAAAEAARIPEFRPAKAAVAETASQNAVVRIVNGRYVVNGRTLWGGEVNEGWWRGSALPAAAVAAGGISITRFVPGRIGPGLTEDLPVLAARMVTDGTPFYMAIPGLWYDRRRDEHSVEARSDAQVWAPFYEMPWARTGQGTAADGLSRYDLTRFNPWYYERLREFGRLCDRNGLVLYHNLYNTHNVLEILQHWVDYPWRPLNNINDTGLPEPPPVEPGNRLHLANEVYDIRSPQRRALHKALILHELDELGESANLFFDLGFQFAGPLAFQEFFQDTVAEWEKKTGRTVRIELATSKEITDAILSDPARARQVAVIDTRYWQYRPDGSLLAPAGGQNKAFRELLGGDEPRPTAPLQVYRQVREYTDRYPDKAVLAWHGGAGPIPILMAGGAQALLRSRSGGHGQGLVTDRNPLDAFVRLHLAPALMNMTPRDGWVANPDVTFCLADDRASSVLLYSLSGPSITLLRALGEGGYTGLWFDPRTGGTRPLEGRFSGAAGDALQKPTEEPWLLLLRS
jgi:hypothetical protein